MRPQPLRRRLMIVIVGVVAGALLVSGFGTLVLLRAQARRDTRRDITQLAANVAHTAELIQRPLRLSALQALLRRTQDVAIVHVPTAGGDRLPRGMTETDLNVSQLQSGVTVSGFDGHIAYGVVPFRLAGGQLFAAAATQPASRGGGAAVYLLLSAATALVVAAGLAEVLARRVTRPVVEAQQATRRIAGGDLSVRVPADQHSTELAGLADSINAMAGNLERLRGAERQFLMSVSHDLRTPLTSIRGFAEALADGTATDTTRAADVIAAEARRLERLVRDLLDLAKLDAQRFSLDLRPVDLLEVVTDTVDGFEPAAEKLGLDLSIHDPVGLDAGPSGAAARWPSVAADPDRLAQLMANLVENAMKFASHHIEVSTWFRPANGSTPGTAQITVDDDGPGIPAADLPRVFDRLWTRGKGREVGSGLGLAIVNELVTAMGGTVTATSPVPRVGTTTGAPASDDTAGTRVVVTLRCWSASA